MDGLQTLDIALFSAGTFAAAFVTGLAGFAFGIIAAAVWLHFLAPAQVAPLIAAFALIVQGVSVWKLRRAVRFGRIWPFVLGSAILWLGGTGMIGSATAMLFLFGLPALALGTWAGLKSFGRLNEAGFRRVVLGLLLLSGVSLLFRV